MLVGTDLTHGGLRSGLAHRRSDRLALPCGALIEGEKGTIKMGTEPLPAVILSGHGYGRRKDQGAARGANLEAKNDHWWIGG